MKDDSPAESAIKKNRQPTDEERREAIQLHIERQTDRAIIRVVVERAKEKGAEKK